MRNLKDLDPKIHGDLAATYEEVMWLAQRPNVTASMARGWYTHVVASKLVRRLREFTGKVSRSAAESDSDTSLRLEHFKRMQTSVTQLVARHRASKKLDPDEFVQLVIDCERVHIVTVAENYAAMRADGNYSKAGIELLDWRKLPPGRQEFLWKRMLHGRVANSTKFKPKLA